MITEHFVQHAASTPMLSQASVINTTKCQGEDARLHSYICDEQPFWCWGKRRCAENTRKHADKLLPYNFIRTAAEKLITPSYSIKAPLNVN